MATVGAGNKKVLVVVDAQVGVMQGTWQAPRIIKNIGTAVAKAREQGAPVIWVQHADEDLVHGSSACQLVPELAPAEGETRIHKQFNSSFEQTPLDERLAELGVTHVW